MRLGFALPTGGPWATPENQVATARAAEALGYRSVWTYTRLLYALEPRNEYPGAPGAEWPSYFRSVADPIVTLAHVAGVTDRVRLGTAVLNPLYTTPVMLAKQLATLDQISGGRVVAGFGLGWSEDEFTAVGTPYARRGRRLDEFLRCLNALWGGGEVEFHGEFYEVPRSLVAPVPVQRPRPPVLIGGYAEATVRRAVTLADGWLGGNVPLAEAEGFIGRLREGAEREGRDPAALELTSRGVVHLRERPEGPGRRALVGSLDEVREDLDRYAELGFGELFVDLNFVEQIAGAHTDPRESMKRAMALMEALAPGG